MKGVLLNNWKGGVMEEDNVKMIEEMTGLPVLAKIRRGDAVINADPALLASLYE